MPRGRQRPLPPPTHRRDGVVERIEVQPVLLEQLPVLALYARDAHGWSMDPCPDRARSPWIGRLHMMAPAPCGVRSPRTWHDSYRVRLGG